MGAKRKVYLVGIDGGTWNLLLPLARGPNGLDELGRIVREGASGNLASTNPPTTPPAWSSSQTGTNPGRHGIYDFRFTPHADPRRSLISLRAIKGLKLWQVLGGAGLKVGYLNVPCLYPPDEVNGFMISGMLTPGPEVDFTHPRSLQKDLFAKFPDYVIDVDIPKYDAEFPEDATVFLDDVEHATRRRIDALFWLLDRHEVDFLMVVFVAFDRLGHLFWKFLDPSCSHYDTPLGGRVRARAIEILRLIDGALGELRRREPDADLLIASDHGFGPTWGYFNVNKMLQDMDLLRVQPGARLRKELFYRAWKVGDHPLTKSLLPRGLQRSVRSRIRSRRSSFVSDVESALDFDKTAAYYASIPAHGIFVRSTGAERERVRDRVARALEDLHHPDGGPMVDRVWRREEIYHGPMTDYAPDLVFCCRDYGVIPRPLLGATDLYRSMESTPNGFHRTDGIFAAVGEGIAAGSRIEGASIVDVAPTVIERFGLPVPPAMEGRALLAPGTGAS